MSTTDLGTLRSEGRQLTFLHSSDLHLGASEHVQRAFELLITTALERQVDLVLLGGDVYDSAERSAKLQKRFVDGLSRLDASGIHVFIAHGNHDPVAADFRPVVGAMPQRVHVFSSGEPQTFVMQVAGDTVAVTGLSFEHRHDQMNLAARIAATEVLADLRLAVVHANVEGQTGHDVYAPCSDADLRHSGIGYWALGHIHQRTITPMGSGRFWAYPGNLQGRSTKPAECGAKGVLIVRAEERGFAEPEFVPTDVHRFLRLEVSLDDVEHYSDAFDTVVAAVGDAFELHGRRSLTVRLTLTGSTGVHGLLSELTVEEVEESLGNPRVRVDRIEDATRRPLDRDALARADDLAASLIGRFDSLRSPGSDEHIRDLLERSSGLIGRKAEARMGSMLNLGQVDLAALLDRVEASILDGLVAEQ